MKVGDYVRTIYGIGKIQRIIPNDYDKKNDYIVLEDFVFNGFELQSFFTADEVKSSPNIIDLVEIGDYVNGSVVIGVNIGYVVVDLCNFDNEFASYSNNEIKSIVTKEQFEEMEYKI